VASEYFYAELIFKLNDGFGDSRLRGEEGLSCGSKVEVLSYGFANKSKLVQIHINPILYISINIGMKFYMILRY
jgi:hypothetical protein